jgi:phage-related protein
LFSKDGFNSEINEYLASLVNKNPNMRAKAIASIKLLPYKIYNQEDVAPMKDKGRTVYWELKIRSSTNICRFFYTIVEPNIVVIHGFTKKTQKTDRKDIEKGLRNLEHYKQNNLAIRPNWLISD